MPLVQPIAVNKSGSHEETIIAVGLAATLCWEKNIDNDIWGEWFKGPFTKSVRRGTGGQMNICQDFDGAYTYMSGRAIAIAMPPMDDEPRFPSPLNRMQVSGLDLTRNGWHQSPREGQLAFVINRSLNMSTGKTAAQMAHAMMAYSRQFGFDWTSDYCVHDNPEFFEYCRYSNDIIVQINDAGKTEIAPGSCTVIATRI